MNCDILLKIGVLVDIKTKSGEVNTGFLDEVGATQSQKHILLTDKRVQVGDSFKGKKIQIEDIVSISLSQEAAPNI